MHPPIHTHAHFIRRYVRTLFHQNVDMNTSNYTLSRTHKHTHTYFMLTLSFAAHPSVFARLNKEISTLLCGVLSGAVTGKRKEIGYGGGEGGKVEVEIGWRRRRRMMMMIRRSEGEIKGEGRNGKGKKVRRITEEPRREVRDGKEKGVDETIVYGRMDKEREEGIGRGM